MSIIGLVLLLASIWFGAHVAASPALASWFDFDARKLAWLLIGYGFFASVLPVWLLLAPRDYLSTFLKIGTIALLALAILVVGAAPADAGAHQVHRRHRPGVRGQSLPVPVHHDRVRRGLRLAFDHRVGNHAEAARPAKARRGMVGYGGMLMEAFVAIMALIAAASLHPGVYFAMNSPAAIIGTTVEHAAATISGWGFMITPAELSETARKIGESTLAQPRGRRADAGGGHGAAAAQHPARRAHDGLLVPLRDPVRGAVHPDHRRCRHARRALHDPGDRRA